MKKILLTLTAVMALVVSALAQDEKPKSISVGTGDGKLSVLYLRDGLDDSYRAVSYRLYSLPTVPGLSINAIGAIGGDGNDVYAGTGLSYSIPTRFLPAGWGFNVVVGMKGFNLSDDFSFASGEGGFVYGFGLSIPIGSF